MADTTTDRRHRSILRRIARRAMQERGLLPDFSPAALAELEAIGEPGRFADAGTRDLRDLIWCSIDNDDSRDLDQLTVAQTLPDQTVRIFVAIADVDALVTKQSALDDHAKQNTTSVYTAAEIFPMLPEKLSTNLTSLNYESDRLAVAVEMVIASDGSLLSSHVYRAMVRNHAKLAYNSLADWLEGNGPMPQPVAKVHGLDANLRLQDRVAQTLNALRHIHGALDLETIEARPVFDGDEIKELRAEKRNRAKEIIEDFMIAGTVLPHDISPQRNFRRYDGWCAHLSVGTDLSNSHRKKASRYRTRPTQPRWSNSSFAHRPPTRSAFPISLSVSLSSWARVSTRSNFRRILRPAISAWRLKIIITRQLRTAHFPL